MIRVALGTARVLGLNNFKMRTLPTTAHFMTPGRCICDCKFCTQAKSSSSNAILLSRISWPEYGEEKVFHLLGKKQDRFKRVCLQVVHSEDVDDILRHVDMIRKSCDLPISVDIKAQDINTVRNYFEVGADVVGLPIDAACSRVYSDIKEGSFNSQLSLIKEAAKEYKGKISTHLILGLGETEREAVELIYDLFTHGVTVGLFAFTPVKGTALEGLLPPNRGHYRRIQMARFLIYNDFSPEIKFDNVGKIVDFGYETEELSDKISPLAFMTTGCPDCNRPYFNESPSGFLFNYPYKPSTEEYHKAFYEAIDGREEFHG